MYVLAILGSFMLRDGIMEIDRIKKKIIIKKKLHTHYWIHGLPFRTRFKTSKVYESALVPIILGVIVGFVAAIMGVGGAFLMVPAMSMSKKISWKNFVGSIFHQNGFGTTLLGITSDPIQFLSD